MAVSVVVILSPPYHPNILVFSALQIRIKKENQDSTPPYHLNFLLFFRSNRMAGRLARIPVTTQGKSTRD